MVNRVKRIACVVLTKDSIPIMNILILLGGLILLVLGANLLVRGASKLALSFGISPLAA